MLAQVAPARAPVHAGDAEIRAMPRVPMIVRMVVKEHAVVRAPIIARVAVRVLVKAHVSPRAPMTAQAPVPTIAGIRATAAVLAPVLALVLAAVKVVVKVHAMPIAPMTVILVVQEPDQNAAIAVGWLQGLARCVATCADDCEGLFGFCEERA